MLRTAYAKPYVDLPKGMKPFRQVLSFVIDLNERGVFKARVENQNGTTVCQINTEDDEEGQNWLVDAGYMRHNRDMAGLLDYLQEMGIAKSNSTLVDCG